MKVRIVEGSIVQQPDIDVVVNAANEQLRAGGGVCGVIFKAAGYPELRGACETHPFVDKDIKCPTGWSVITPAFKLPNKAIIHAVGPIYDEGQVGKCRALLRSAYVSSLKLASFQGYKSIAFPAISCGVYGYPWEEAAKIALDACDSYFKTCPTVLEEIRFVIFEPELLTIFEAEAKKLGAVSNP